MRWSNCFISTLRDEPANVQAVSHKLLLRGGYIQQLAAGIYSILPLAQRVRLKIIDIIRQEMNEIGAQEFMLSALQPLELWEESGRLEAVSDIMFRLKDRKDSPLALGLTHEEVFTSIARNSLNSYKQLPQMWYQIQTKFRDELRPKGGLLRVREFTMKDSYSFDVNDEGLDKSYVLHREAYKKIFSRCGIPFTMVEASSGAMGGSASAEFMVASESGEDTIVVCDACNYAANLEKAQSAFEKDTQHSEAAIEKFHTPAVRTIKQLEEFGEGYPASKQVKTLVMRADERLVIALVQGDQELNESKLQSALAAATLRAATESEIVDALGAQPGSLGACGVEWGDGKKIHTVIADSRLEGRTGMVTGANQNDYHLKNVSITRDMKVARFVDLHTVKGSEKCSKCSASLSLKTALEIGHIFKLGTRYSEKMNAHVLTSEGARTPILMGSYGIGVERLLAAVVEQHHDEHGIIWPLSVAPFQVAIVPINWANDDLRNHAEKLYSELRARGIEVLLDDRNERAGVKFNDMDLIGIPLRITVGKKVEQGLVEFKKRGDKDARDIVIDHVAQFIVDEIAMARSSG